MNQQTVTVSAKNSTSFILGIIGLCFGILGLLVSWIPFLGLLAIPLGALGGLLALIGVIVAMCKNFSGLALPIVGGVISIIAIAASVLITGASSVAISDSMEEANRMIEEQEMQELQYAEKILVQNLSVKYVDSYKGRVASVSFDLKNTGDKDVEYVALNCFFLDEMGNAVAEESISPFNRFDNILKPGYVWSIGEGKSFQFQVPQEWKEGSIRLEIADIDFANQ